MLRQVALEPLVQHEPLVQRHRHPLVAQRGEEALDAPDALDLQLYFKAHSYIVCLILSIKREQNMHLRMAAI